MIRSPDSWLRRSLSRPEPKDAFGEAKRKIRPCRLPNLSRNKIHEITQIEITRTDTKNISCLFVSLVRVGSWIDSVYSKLVSQKHKVDLLLHQRGLGRNQVSSRKGAKGAKTQRRILPDFASWLPLRLCVKFLLRTKTRFCILVSQRVPGEESQTS